ncbi:suppressor of fused domain protein [Anatilimnocola floriformis]|uniref:suppressor of fused domain protein n=1 Tax=Anatilimnocola floriformis TaxID=2948575 RepID=UPI0020C1ECA1|nr:suppressor of fused domain protein [Anatilimnocola floriformis]
MSESDENELDDKPNTSGWDAIDQALQPLYGEQEPLHYGAVLPASLGGDDPLQGISVYCVNEPVPHFHYVTYGFTELYDKDSPDPQFSGYGFEMTFRLARGVEETDPPTWPLNMLQNLARYVFRTGNFFDERHHLPANGPIAIGEPTDMTALLFIRDPQLPEVNSPNGYFKFIQLVGLCTAEYALLKEGYFDEVLERILTIAPLGVTNIYRDSILSDPAVEAAIRSAPPTVKQSELFGTIVEWRIDADTLQVRLGANLIADVSKLLVARLGEGERLSLYGKGTAVVFEPGEETGWQTEEGAVVIQLTPATVAEIGSTLEERRGEYRLAAFPELHIEVVPVEIKDGNGDVIRTIG